jgi:hypothetical protein
VEYDFSVILDELCPSSAATERQFRAIGLLIPGFSQAGLLFSQVEELGAVTTDQHVSDDGKIAGFDRTSKIRTQELDKVLVSHIARRKAVHPSPAT